MELMVARNDLVQRARVGVFLENDRVVQQVQEPLSIEHAPDERLQFEGTGFRIAHAIDRAPDLEPLLVGRYLTHTSL